MVCSPALVRGALATLAASTCLLLGACRSETTSAKDGGSAPASASPPSAVAPPLAAGQSRACALVTVAEATSALGAPATNGESKTTGASSRCTYDASSGGLIVIVSDQGQTAFDKAHAAAASKAPGTLSELSGIGEGAFVTSGGPLASVMFRKGTFAVTVILTVQSSARPPVEKATALARAAATRI